VIQFNDMRYSTNEKPAASNAWHHISEMAVSFILSSLVVSLPILALLIITEFPL
jgi:hypothetical protein